MKPGQVHLTPVSDRRFHAKGLYGNFIPLPLVHLTDDLGLQHVHIAPEAFNVAKAEFPDQIKFWQDSLPGPLKGKLESVREQAVSPLLEINRPCDTAQRRTSTLYRRQVPICGCRSECRHFWWLSGSRNPPKLVSSS